MLDQIFIVIPCFNEENNILRTCLSFNFPNRVKTSNNNTILILVDNNSTDSTDLILQKIRQQSPVGKVYIITETEQGYVPARHRGNILARDIANNNNWDIKNVLIIQADADTLYSPNYLEAVSLAAEEAGLNVILETCVGYDLSFAQQLEEYLAICKNIDSSISDFLPNNPNDDILIDDKVASYRLSDYFQWGGHKREFNLVGDEIYAETTRLFISAKARQAKKVFIETTKAYHSPRKIYSNIAVQFALAGFPRELQYKQSIINKFKDINNLTDFYYYMRRQPEALIEIRRLHLIAILGILPFQIGHFTGENPAVENNSLIKYLLPFLPKRSKSQLISRPGLFLEDVFNLIAQKGSSIVKKIPK